MTVRKRVYAEIHWHRGSAAVLALPVRSGGH